LFEIDSYNIINIWVYLKGEAKSEHGKLFGDLKSKKLFDGIKTKSWYNYKDKKHIYLNILK